MSLSSDHSALRTAQRLPDDASNDKIKGDRRKTSCAQPRCRKEGLFPAPCAESDFNANSYSNSGEQQRARPRLCLEHARDANGAWNIFAGMSDAEVERAIRAAAVGERPTWPVSPPFKARKGAGENRAEKENAGRENSSRDFWQNSLHEFLNDPLSPFYDTSRASPRASPHASPRDSLATNGHDERDALSSPNLSSPNVSWCHPRTQAQREACRVMSLTQPICAQQLKARYRALAKAHHPDQHLAKVQRKKLQDDTSASNEARTQQREQQEEQERFKQINAAYALLQELLQQPTTRKPV